MCFLVMRPRMEIENIIEENNKKVIIASAGFLSAWVQCVQSTFQGNWLLEAVSPTGPSSSTSAAQMEPYLPVKSTDEGIDGTQFDKIKRCAEVSNAVEKRKRNGNMVKLLSFEKVQSALYLKGFSKTLNLVSSKLIFH